VKIYKQLLIILTFSLIGEIIARFIVLQLPGSIIGLLLLFVLLQMKLIKIDDFKEVGDFLLNNMAILFVPAAVAIMEKFSTIADIWWQIVFIVVLSIMVNIFVIGKIVQWIKIKFEGELHD
jgi:holin-like protein